MQGVRGVDGGAEAAHEAHTRSGDNGLMQVQCQVLNASRWSA